MEGDGLEGMVSKHGAARQGYTIHQGHGVGEGIKHGDEVGEGIHLGYKSVSISCPGMRHVDAEGAREVGVFTIEFAQRFKLTEGSPPVGQNGSPPCGSERLASLWARTGFKGNRKIRLHSHLCGSEREFTPPCGSNAKKRRPPCRPERSREQRWVKHYASNPGSPVIYIYIYIYM